MFLGEVGADGVIAVRIEIGKKPTLLEREMTLDDSVPTSARRVPSAPLLRNARRARSG
jgi:hypothetical protein